MATSHSSYISKVLGLNENGVSSVIRLLNEGATIPFISRYRKEASGGMDEVQIAAISEERKKQVELDKRKGTVLKSIEEQSLLTPEIKHAIEAAMLLHVLEDIYLPFKPKRKTRATEAKAKGLEPLAKIIMSQKEQNISARAQQYVNKQVATIEEALQGARDIAAEWVAERIGAREIVRSLYINEGILSGKVRKGKEEAGAKYSDYFNYSETLRKCVSHRFLAIQRAEAEEILRVKLSVNEEYALQKLSRLLITNSNPDPSHMEMIVADSFKRLIAPAIENEVLQGAKERADVAAIHVFAENLTQLLLAAPLGKKRVLAIDPAFRTGCKIVCLDEAGKMLHNETIYPHAPQKKMEDAIKKLHILIDAHKVEAIAIGNGTASRETEYMVKRMKFRKEVQVFVVSEDGASVYSASSVAREEFPQYDVTVRGAISIGRRLIDPLAELVKIDPKSIGVGQYQHDVNQKMLKDKLDEVVVSAVNKVGVNVNTASKHLLLYVSGLGPQLAQNIVEYRQQKGLFKSRGELLSVPKLGAKAFEQCAGFMRIPGASNPLDDSAVHPESYVVVEKMAKDAKVPLTDLVGNKEVIATIAPKNYVSEKTGILTLEDILAELAKPSRDPRKRLKMFEFSREVQRVEDLKEGMKLPGIVTNITNFGAFVDVGVKQDGLVHISELADDFVSNPADVVKLHQHVMVTVKSVDIPRKRIGLSMKEQPTELG